MDEEKKIDETQDTVEIQFESENSRREFITKVLGVAGAVAVGGLMSGTADAQIPPGPGPGTAPAAPKSPGLAPLASGQTLQQNALMTAQGLPTGMSIRIGGPNLSQALMREGLGSRRPGSGTAASITLTWS